MRPGNVFSKLRAVFTGVILFLSAVLVSCEADDPVKEDIPETITQVRLHFRIVGSGNDVIVTATDPDGEGVQGLMQDNSINLKTNTTYALEIRLFNGLVDSGASAYDVTNEVDEESDEHLFFFSWTNNVFGNPSGDGNIDNRQDEVAYEDDDENGLPVGLSTLWFTNGNSSGKFRIMLKHQPDLKSETSTSETGETDVDITFDINIQ